MEGWQRESMTAETRLDGLKEGEDSGSRSEEDGGGSQAVQEVLSTFGINLLLEQPAKPDPEADPGSGPAPEPEEGAAAGTEAELESGLRQEAELESGPRQGTEEAHDRDGAEPAHDQGEGTQESACTPAAPHGLPAMLLPQSPQPIRVEIRRDGKFPPSNSYLPETASSPVIAKRAVGKV